MTGHQSLQFVEYLRQAGHLKAADAVGATDTGAPNQMEGNIRRALQSAALGKLWEVTNLSAGEFANEVARYYNYGLVTLQDMLSATPLVAAFSPRFLRETVVIHCRDREDGLRRGIGRLTDLEARRAAEIFLGPNIEIKVASFDDLTVVLDQRLAGDEVEGRSDADSVQQLREDDIESLRDLASGAPVVRAVSDLLEKAVELRASDIHIEPFQTDLVVRMRIDGLLREVNAPAGVLPQAVISRIKIISGLNIAERRLPQDGAARLRAGRADIDIRVAIMPTQHGESAVIRILPKDRGLLVLDKLGLATHDETRLRRLLKLPHGMIVITGPTGSGKTTTLATILSILNEPIRKILTIEDPVEYEIRGVNQSQIKPAIGLTFAAALRSFVRQDPDVIMVGEIRDSETAHVAVHAALTGHLVLTTLHTETAAAALPRLLDLGIEAYLLRSTLRAVIAQRLVRQLCERCKSRQLLCEADFTGDPRLAALGFTPGEIFHAPMGCERCGGSGYRGRLGVFEVLELDDELRGLIGEKTDGLKIDQTAIRAGMTTMLDDGLSKCRAGLTSPAEILRVTTTR